MTVQFTMNTVWARRCALAGALLLLLGTRVGAQPPQDPFGGLGGSRKTNSESSDRISFTVAVNPAEAKPGSVFTLTIKGTLKPGFHTYPLTMRAAGDAQDTGQLSKIRIEAPAGFELLYPVRETAPKFDRVDGVGWFLEHKGPFEWAQDVFVKPDAPPGTEHLKIHVRAQVCDTSCVWVEPDITVSVKVLAGSAAVVTPELQARLGSKPPAIEERQPPGSREASHSAVPAPPEGESPPETPGARGLAGFLAASVGAALLMLVTPCVFPMIPITVSFFLKQSERKDHNALVSAGVYSITIVAVLALAVLLLGQIIINLANSAWLNLALGMLLVFFALSLLGMYEIELPSGLARFTAAREGQGGYVGAMFMALTFTITSFTCTGPFLGPLLVAVKESPLGPWQRALGALCYAATFAAPFFVLALFPSLLKRLPKSGGWLNAVKVVMGFLELAAALKFLANMDLAWHPGAPILFNYETVLCSWIALSACCGFYLFGAYRLPHDTPLDHLGVGRMLLGAGFLSLGIYMAPALWRVTPLGAIGRGLVAFLPLDTRAAGEWNLDYEEAWREAVGQHKLIFVDFTGQNCTNCRYNELNVFPQPAIRRELEKFARVQLYTDFVPDSKLSPADSEAQGRKNSELQSATVGDVSNPLYAIVRPDTDQPFERTADGGLRIKGKILGQRKGLIARDQLQDFEAFLHRAQASPNDVAALR
jgi:thiol:disulfide interchange protein DsbD